MPAPLRILLGVLAAVALLIGVFLWTGPDDFSGANTGEAMECTEGVCQIIDIDEDAWGENPQLEFSELPRTVLFEGTQVEANDWVRRQHLDWARPRAVAWMAGGVVLLGLVLLCPRTKAKPTEP